MLPNGARFFTHLAGDYAVAWRLSHEMNLPPSSDGQRNRNKARHRIPHDRHQ
jgi:hypothetical protein